MSICKFDTPSKTMLNCHRMGLPRMAAKMLTTTLNNTIYKLKTEYGLSA